MALTLIVGPMKSGKSLELIARVAPYQFAKEKVLYVQPVKNVRDAGISSRVGLQAQAEKVKSLADVRQNFDIIGIDEFHMFNESDARIIQQWLIDGRQVFISGLDVDYRGKLIPIMSRMYELKPEQIIIKEAVCEVCQQYTAKYTQILQSKKPITKGLPVVVPEDGTYTYQTRCRTCFVAP